MTLSEIKLLSRLNRKQWRFSIFFIQEKVSRWEKKRQIIYFCGMESNMSQLFYTANLVFILTNLYGWLIKWFYKAEAYSGNFGELFPGQRFVGALYLVQVFEIPYLVMIGDAKALFYVNSFSALLFPALMFVMCEVYFFLRTPSVRKLILYFLPVATISCYLLAAMWGWIPFSGTDKQIMFWVITVITCGYAALIAWEQYKIRKQVRKINEMSYSSESDFPVRFAQRIEWLPLGISLLMYLNFAADDVWVKMGRDVFFTFVNVWFLFYTLNPHRRPLLKEERVELQDNGKYRLSEKRCSELQAMIFDNIVNKKLYLDRHLSIESLSKEMGTNNNYVSEAFVRSQYGSFYNAINQYRIDHATDLLINQPEMSIGTIAESSGFSSASMFSRLFKQYKGISPSGFVAGDKS